MFLPGSVIYVTTTEQAGLRGNISDLYSESSRFESRSYIGCTDRGSKPAFLNRKVAKGSARDGGKNIYIKINIMFSDSRLCALILILATKASVPHICSLNLHQKIIQVY
jgi:hypothetical protein